MSELYMDFKRQCMCGDCLVALTVEKLKSTAFELLKYQFDSVVHPPVTVVTVFLSCVGRPNTFYQKLGFSMYVFIHKYGDFNIVLAGSTWHRP